MNPLEAVVVQRLGHALTARVQDHLPGWAEEAGRRRGQSAAAFTAAVERGEEAAVEALIEEAVVRETYLFRHPSQLQLAANRVAPRAHPGRPLRIWSAGCSTGEEVCSFAIALREYGVPAEAMELLGTDISAQAIATAQQGSYGTWSFRATPAELKARYFQPEGTLQRLREPLRGRMLFARHNLLSQAPAQGFDVILCRNVLLYFQPDRARAVLATLAAALGPVGLLVLGYPELTVSAGLGLQPVEDHDVTVLARPPAAGVADAAPARAPAPMPAPQRPARAPAEPRAAGPRSDSEEASQCLQDALAAEQRGDYATALVAARRAGYLQPSLEAAHALKTSALRRLQAAGQADGDGRGS
ncbi:MAG: methyltransferase domain-containing protein [Myxococcota bacterium]|nr:methyltransferase domain-containing protein [Myxococcota bacterium]